MQPARRWVPGKEPIRLSSRGRQFADVRPLLERLVAALGNNAVARLLGLSPAVVSRVRRGGDTSAETARRVGALHAVLTRAMAVFEPSLAIEWLTEGQEPLLGGARPIDVLAWHGAAPVLEALDGIEAGVMG